MGEKRIFSFDIFDTCLVRICGKPENVIYMLGLDVLGESVDETILRDFVRERISSETTAKQKLKKEAVTLQELYDFFDISIYTDKTKEDVASKEIAIERSVLTPVKGMIRKIEEFRKKGRVLFVSDMYLSSHVLQDILKSYGLMCNDDEIYVSGEIGLTKESGALFNYVKDKENIKFKNWTHFGDNFLSDYIRPRKLGIHAKRVCHPYSTIEKKWIKEGSCFRNNWVVSTFAGWGRSLRLANSIAEDDFVVDAMIPGIVPSVISLLQKAEKDGIDRLYFASRDTRVFFLLSQNVKHLFPGIELKYLHISTKVVYASSIVNGTAEELIEILDLLGDFKPRKALVMFGFSEKEMESFAEYLNLDKKYSHSELKLLVELLLEANNNKILMSHCREQRQKLLAYLEQENFLSRGNVALFDIGWRCTSQMMLRRIMKKDIQFYYYGVHRSRYPMSKTGSLFSFSFFEDMPRLGAANFIEYYMCKTLEGSTIGYFDDGSIVSPVLDKCKFSQEEINDYKYNLKLLEYGMKTFCKMPVLISEACNIFTKVSLKSLNDIAKNPPREMVKFLSKRMYSDHFVDKQKMVLYMLPHTIIDILYQFCHKTHKYDNLWIEGSLVNTFGLFANFLLSHDLEGIVLRLGRRIKGYLK